MNLKVKKYKWLFKKNYSFTLKSFHLDFIQKVFLFYFWTGSSWDILGLSRIYLPLNHHSNRIHWTFNHFPTCHQNGFNHTLWLNVHLFLLSLDRSKTCHFHFLKWAQKELGISCSKLLPNWFPQTKDDFQFNYRSKIDLKLPSCQIDWPGLWWKVYLKDRCNCLTIQHLCQVWILCTWYFRRVSFGFQRKKERILSTFHTLRIRDTKSRLPCYIPDNWEFMEPYIKAFLRERTCWFSFF